MQKVAEGMDCVLVYAVIPKSTLTRMLEVQTGEKARALLRPVAQTMSLENQSVNSFAETDQRQRLQDHLLKNPRQLWR
ncbi:MAG: hypothetical protein LBK76_05975 [Verrucomicrobiales bacterium]|jgi:hypothetical protein|nr:hypothetical protein [Verrucomicrobiales bacterium]